MDASSLIDPVVNAVLSVAIKETYQEIKSIIKSNIDRTTLLSTAGDLEANMIEEIRKTSNWAFDDLFKNHQNHSDITSRYVHLDLLLEPRREHTNKSQLTRKL